MEINERSLSGVFEINPSPHEDDRGFFMRIYDEKIFSERNINKVWVQENQSRSLLKGTIRGLHFQFPPFSEAKLVRVIRGSIYDVFVDLRKGSPTFGKWDSIELSEDNKIIILIPRGFAHGFCTLSDLSEVIYKVDNYYAPDYEGGIIWNDKELAINWPTSNPVLSKKDSMNISFLDFRNEYNGIITEW